jgi:hypothetical protein
MEEISEEKEKHNRPSEEASLPAGRQGSAEVNGLNVRPSEERGNTEASRPNVTADIIATPSDMANASRDRAKSGEVLRSAGRTHGPDEEIIKKIASERKTSWFSKTAKTEKGLPRGIAWGVAGLILLFVGSFGYLLYATLLNRVSQSVVSDANRLRAGVENLRNLDFKSAEEVFSSTGDGPGFTLDGVINQLKPFFRTTAELTDSFKKISSSGIGLAKETAFFQNEFLDAFLGQRGPDILGHLRATENFLADFVHETDSLVAHAVSFEQVPSGTVRDAYFPLKLDIAKLQNFLAVLTDWLGADSPRHVLLMFQNPSEIRPGGGFLGSYADVTLVQGGLGGVDVRDINDSDRELKENIIPPKPLQAVVTRLRAADANWFFDFAESAGQVVKLMEASELYKGTSTPPVTFDAAIAISPKVIEDILAVIGPIELKKEKLVFDSKNFLEEIQQQVQLGQATRATYPKAILKELSTEMFAKIRLLDEEQRREMISLAESWTVKKEIMVYAKDEALERFLEGAGAAGTLYAPAANFEGDYLAVVDANVGGGKSDIYVSQDVLLQSQISASGTVADHLVIRREHRGNTAKYSWYKLPNEDYLQVFIPPGSTLTNTQGGAAKTIYPAANYAKNNYVNDPAVGAMNSSTQKLFNYPSILRREEADREVLATWSEIKAGEKAEIVFDYTHRLFLEPTDGAVYQFVFEKQAGTKRHYKFEIGAPVGFKFQENDLPVYEYESDDPPGRLTIDLTLKSI